MYFFQQQKAKALMYEHFNIYRTYAGKLRNPVSRRYLCVKNNDLRS